MMEERNREYAVRETKRQIGFWLVLALVVILAGVLAARALADEPKKATPTADTPKTPHLDDQAVRDYLIASMARSAAESAFSDALTDDAKKKRDNLNQMAQKEQKAYSALQEQCGPGARPLFDSPQKQGDLPTNMHCVATPTPPPPQK